MPEPTAPRPRGGSGGRRPQGGGRRGGNRGGASRGGGSGGGASRGRSGGKPGARSGQPQRARPEREVAAPVAVRAPIEPVPDDSAAAAAANRRRAALVVSVPALVALVVVGVVVWAAASLVAGLVAGVVAGVLVVVSLWRGSAAVLLRALHARPVDEDDVPRVATLVEGLCASMGVAIPDLYLVDDPLPDALALGPRPALVLTTGLLDALDPVSLEGVLAHELVHLKRDDVRPATVAAALLLVAVVVPGGAGIVHGAAGRGREFAADRQAVRVTRYPPGLAQALGVLSGPVPGGGGALSSRRVGQVTRWLWTAVLPDAGGRRPEGDETIGELDVPSVRLSALDEW